MTKSKSVWMEQGYTLFAEEGLDGLRVERLARILQLNKSGFYHYFGDMDGYCVELLHLHKQKFELYFKEISSIKTIDPDWFKIAIKFKVQIIFQRQLLRCKKNSVFYQAAEALDQEAGLLSELWSEYLGLGYAQSRDLAIRHFCMVRDMFYTRASLQNLTYEFIHSVFSEAKILLHQIAESKTIHSALTTPLANQSQ